jgi:hypothetical protein
MEITYYLFSLKGVRYLYGYVLVTNFLARLINKESMDTFPLDINHVKHVINNISQNYCQ